jgi:hypothetical protein
MTSAPVLRALVLAVGLASPCVPMSASRAQGPQDLDKSLARLVDDYIRLYTRDSLPTWRRLFLPTFTAASTTADSGVTVRSLDEFYGAQERGFAGAKRMGERLENVKTERRGRMATIWADFVYWHDADERRGRLVLSAIFSKEGWRFHSLMFSYHD